MIQKECKRCGQCCYYYKEGVKTRCRYLVKLPNNKTLCRIYNNRIGKIIYYNVLTKVTIRCVKREYDNRLFINCPLNSLDK